MGSSVPHPFGDIESYGLDRWLRELAEATEFWSSMRTRGLTRLPGIKIHDTRMIRPMETLLHAGTCLHRWTSASIHQAIVQTYDLTHYTIK